MNDLGLFVATAAVGTVLTRKKRQRPGQSHLEQHQEEILQRAHTLRCSLDRPAQSQFRVVAILQLENGQRVAGTNLETSPCMGNSLCAERAALARLRIQETERRWQEGSNQGPPTQLQAVFIVTDSVHKPTPPGMLCREAMLGYATEQAMKRKQCVGHDNNNGDILLLLQTAAAAVQEAAQVRVVSQSANEASTVVSYTLGQLYPHPSPYLGLTAAQAVCVGMYYQQQRQENVLEKDRTSSPSSLQLSVQQVDELMTAARDSATLDSGTTLHPIQYGAAAAVVENDQVVILTAHQVKAVEYGATLDAVGQLASQLRDAKQVQAIVCNDQYGIIHAPSAVGRSFLVEHGFGHVPCLWTEFCNDTWRLVAVPAQDLAPYAPDIFNSCLF